MRVRKIWNHLYQGKRHSNLTAEEKKYYLALSHASEPKDGLAPATKVEAQERMVDGSKVSKQVLTIKSIGRQAYGSTSSMPFHPVESEELPHFQE